MGRIILDNSCRIAYNYCVVRHIPNHNTTGTNCDIIANPHVPYYDNISSQSNIVAYSRSLAWFVIRFVTDGSVLTASKVTTNIVCIEIR